MGKLHTFLKTPWSEKEEVNPSGIKIVRAGLIESLKLANERNWDMLIEHTSNKKGIPSVTKVIDVKILNERNKNSETIDI